MHPGDNASWGRKGDITDYLQFGGGKGVVPTDQVTEYVYENSQNARWVSKIKYPATDTDNGKTLGQPSTESYDQIAFTYHVDGTPNTRTDQNGTVLTSGYDALRRPTSEKATTLGSYTGGSVDGGIRAIQATYDSEGLITQTTSYTDTAMTTVANQVKYTYNDADKLTKEEQEVDGAVDGSTLAVQFNYGTDYASAYYNRLDNMVYPDARKIWFGYTHSGGVSTFQDTINDEFNRVGQIARDNSGSIGDLLAYYDFNGTAAASSAGSTTRAPGSEGTGQCGNDTRNDLWHGTSGTYADLDRFGRIVDYKYTDFSGTASSVGLLLADAAQTVGRRPIPGQS